MEALLRYEKKKAAELRRRQRKWSQVHQNERMAREKERNLISTRCKEMATEDFLSRRYEDFEKERINREELEKKREEELCFFRKVARKRDEAKCRGLPLSTGLVAGEDRMQILQNRIDAASTQALVAQKARLNQEERQSKAPKDKKFIYETVETLTLTKFKQAVCSLDCDAIMGLLQNIVDWPTPERKYFLNYESRNNFTPLLVSIIRGRLKVTRRLLEMGASTDMETQTGFTPLATAIVIDDLVAVELLCEFSASIGYETKGGVTSLHIAAEMGRDRILTCLLQKGADVNAVNSNGRTALIQAVISHQHAAANVLLAYDAMKEVKDEMDRTASDWAQILKFHSLGFLLNDTKFGAVRRMEIKMEEDELEDCQDYFKATNRSKYIQRNEESALLEGAIATKDVLKLKQLLTSSCTICSINHESREGYTPLMVCSRYGSLLDVQYCLDIGCIPTHHNRKGVTALMEACYNANLNVMELLIQAGCDLRTRDFNGETGYQYLYRYGHKELVYRLKIRFESVRLGSASILQQGTPYIVQHKETRLPRLPSTSKEVNEDESETCEQQVFTERMFPDDSDPTLDPVIRSWTLKQKALKADRNKRETLESERSKILTAHLRGRRNGLAAHLPFDPAGRQKVALCQQCKAKRSKRKCINCDRLLCLVCYTELHMTGQRRRHMYESVASDRYVGWKFHSELTLMKATSLPELAKQGRTCVHEISALYMQEIRQAEQPKADRIYTVDDEVHAYVCRKQKDREKLILDVQQNKCADAYRAAETSGDENIYARPTELTLATLYISQKQFDKARAVLRSAQKIIRQACGLRHPTLMEIAVLKGKMELEIGDYRASTHKLRNALSWFEAHLPVDNKHVHAGMKLLVDALEKQGERSNAIQVCRQTIVKQRQSLPETHPLLEETTTTLNQLLQRRECYDMSCEDIFMIEKHMMEMQQRDEERNANKRKREQLRNLLLHDKSDLAKFLEFTKLHFADDLLSFWIGVEEYRNTDTTSDGSRVLAVYIYCTYIKSRKLKMLTTVQRKSIRRLITTPGKKLPSTLFDEAQTIVFDVILNGVYKKYAESKYE